MNYSICKKLLAVLVLCVAVFSFQGCEKDEDVNWDKEANTQLLNVMNDYYYWYNQMPSIDPNNYSNPKELLEALRVNPPDKWSYITTKQELEAYYNSGAYYGFGFGNAFDQNGNLWILYAFKSSPFYQKGITRGWRISTIEGVKPTPDNYNQLIGASEAGVSKTFGLVSPDGASVSYTFTKSEIIMNTVLFDSVYSFNSKKIGYMVLNGFITPTESELDNCFSKFKAESITELIVDLRYNGGGSVDVSNYLADLIGGNVANGKVYATYFHNDKNSSRNESITFKILPNTISLNRVIFITTNGTASASELVINGLKPFMPVYLIGSKTHGKPVGMYAFEYKEFDWAFVPICFSLKNANNEGDYFNGISVTVEAGDDVSKPFGDVNETSFAAALSYIGVSPAKKVAVKSSLQPKLITGKGLYEEIGAW